MENEPKKRSGRPPGNPMPYIRSLRFAERDRVRLHALSGKWELSEADVIRRAVREAAQREGLE